jgi:endoglucanase
MKKLLGYQKGVNLGGWLSQHKYDIDHIKSFIKEEDISRIKDMGCDHVRLPVDFEYIYDEKNKVDNVIGYKYIDLCLNWCERYGLNLVLDLHKAPGYVFDNDDYSKDFFHDEELQTLFLDIWDRLSTRYAKYTKMMMFELLNEVNDPNVVKEWNELAFKAIKVIRKNCPDVKILYGSVNASSVSTVKFIPHPYDKNIVFNIHCYEPLVFTHQGAYWIKNNLKKGYEMPYPLDEEKFKDIVSKVPMMNPINIGEFDEAIKMLRKDFFIKFFKDAVKYAEDNDVPLYCGEYGVINLASPQDSLNWLKDINKAFVHYGIGRAIWSYKEMDFGIIDKHYENVFDELIKYL